MVDDRWTSWIERIAAAPLRSPERIGVALLQAGMLTGLVFLPVSIAATNIGLGVAWAGVLLSRAPVHRTAAWWWGIAYVGWQLLSRVVAPLRDGGTIDAKGLGLIYTWTCLPLAQLAFDGRLPGAIAVRRWGLRALAITVSVAALLGLLQFTLGWDTARKPLRLAWPAHPAAADRLIERGNRSGGFFSIHLTHGVVLGCALCLLLWSRGWAEAGRGWRIITGSCALIGLSVSGARLAFVGMAAAVAAAIAAKGWRWLAVAAAAAVLIIAVAGTILHLTNPERLQRTLAMQDGRWPIWRTSLTVARDHVLFGAGGPRRYQQIYRDIYLTVVPDIPSEFPNGAPHAHNSLLSLAAEHGIPAAILYLALIIAVLVRLRRHVATNDPSAWRTSLALTALIIVAGQFENLAGDGESSHALWTLLGLVMAAQATQWERA